MLKLPRELPVRTKPFVVLNPMSPPLSSSAYPEFMENVTFTSEPLWTQVTVPTLPEIPRLLLVNDTLLADAAGAKTKMIVAARSRTANRQVALLKTKYLLRTETAHGSQHGSCHLRSGPLKGKLLNLGIVRTTCLAGVSACFSSTAICCVVCADVRPKTSLWVVKKLTKSALAW